MNITISKLIKIAVKYGWTVRWQVCADGSMRFGFHRSTSEGVPFSFEAVIGNRSVASLMDEIISFVDALDPESVASEWMKASGNQSPSRYFRAVADLDFFRSQAWLLAWDLSAEGGREIAPMPWGPN